MTAARDTVAAIAAERAHRTFRECVYCGAPSYGLACAQHRPLLRNDPNYYELRLRTGGAEEGAPRT